VTRQHPGETAAGLGIGSILRDAREQKRLTFDDVEREIRIRSRYLEALEAERFEALPGDAYVRAFLREYSRFLGLDGDHLAAEYVARFPKEDEPVPAPPVLAQRGRWRGGRALIVICALGISIAAILLAWRPGTGGGEKPATSSTHPPAPVVRHRPKPKPKPPPPPPPAPPARLFLTAARGDCWLLIRRGSETGPEVWQGTLHRGQTRSFGIRPLWIRVGAPENLVARLGARPLRLPLAQTGNLVFGGSGLHAV
jgi:transcriptional regulator with XRE-family HTH domain